MNVLKVVLAGILLLVMLAVPAVLVAQECERCQLVALETSGITMILPVVAIVGMFVLILIELLMFALWGLIMWACFK